MSKIQGFAFGIVSEDKACVKFIQRLLSEDDDWRCQFEYSSLESFLMSGESGQGIRFLLLDVQLSGLSGEMSIEIFRRLLSRHTKIVMLGEEASGTMLIKVLRRGADGFLTKERIDDQLGYQLWGIRKQGILLTPDLAEKLVQKLFVESQAYQETGLLTPTDWDILYRLSEGDTYEQAATQLGLTLNTFRYHIKKLFRTLSVESSREAVNWYHKRVMEGTSLQPLTI